MATSLGEEKLWIRTRLFPPKTYYMSSTPTIKPGYGISLYGLLLSVDKKKINLSFQTHLFMKCISFSTLKPLISHSVIYLFSQFLILKGCTQYHKLHSKGNQYLLQTKLILDFMLVSMSILVQGGFKLILVY